MKKIYLLVIVLLVLLATLTINLYFLSKKVIAPIVPVTSCIQAGEIYQSPAVSGVKKGKCCSGLTVIEQATNPDCEQAKLAGGQDSICSACGNGRCEQWENKCNCPQDCNNNCAKEGEGVGGSAVGSKQNCCQGLKAMSGFEYNGGCSDIRVPGSAVICSSKCGNGICESWENGCNCPSDCQKIGNGLRIPKNNAELQSCVHDFDCLVVEAKTCCGCFEVINGIYDTYWNSLQSEKCVVSTACPVCKYNLGNSKGVCINNVCQVKSKW